MYTKSGTAGTMQYRLGDAICEKERVGERGRPSLDLMPLSKRVQMQSEKVHPKLMRKLQ